MPIASNNEFPSVLLKEVTVPASPAAGDQRLYLDSADHKFKRVNSGGTVTTIEGAGTGGALTLISQVIVGAGGSSVTFSSIPGTYKSLLIHAQVRLSGATNYVGMQFNGDTAGNYYYNDTGYQAGAFGGSGVAQTAGRFAEVSGSGASANYASAVEVLIPNYAGTSWFKAYLASSWDGGVGTGVTFVTLQTTGQWNSTAAITQIVMPDTYAQNSVFNLYGVS